MVALDAQAHRVATHAVRTAVDDDAAENGQVGEDGEAAVGRAQGGGTQRDRLHHAGNVGDGDQVVDLEGPFDEQPDAGEHVAEHVLEGESDSQAGETTEGEQQGQRYPGGDQAAEDREEVDDGAADVADQGANLWIGAGALHGARQDATQETPDREDQDEDDHRSDDALDDRTEDAGGVVALHRVAEVVEEILGLAGEHGGGGEHGRDGSQPLRRTAEDLLRGGLAGLVVALGSFDRALLDGGLRLLLDDAQRGDLDDQLVRVDVHERDALGQDDVAHVKAGVDLVEAAHVDAELRGQVGGQAFDAQRVDELLDGADARLGHGRRLAGDHHGHVGGQLLEEVDGEEIGVDGAVGARIDLHLAHQHLLGAAAVDAQVDELGAPGAHPDAVEQAGRCDDRPRQHVVSVEHGGDQPLAAQGLVVAAPLLARRCRQFDRCHTAATLP